MNTDAYANSLSAWRIATTGTPWMEGLDLSEEGKVSHFVPGRNGHMVTTATPGPKVGAAPFYLGADAKQESFSVDPGSIAAAFWTSLAMVMLYVTLSGIVVRRLALIATAIVAFATPMWSVSANALWTHPIDVFGLAVAGLALRKNRLWLAGAGFAIGELARPHVACIAACAGLFLAWRQRSLRPLVQVGTPAAFGLALLSLWSAYNTGEFNPLGGYDTAPSIAYGGSRDSLLGILGFFVSPTRGLFVWTPILLFLIPSMIVRWRNAPSWSIGLALGGVCYTALQIYSNPYGGDAFWGYRHALEFLICVAPFAVATSAQAVLTMGRWFWLLIGLQFSLIATGSIVDNLMWLGPLYGHEWDYHPIWPALEPSPILRSSILLGLAAIPGLMALLMKRVNDSRVLPAPDSTRPSTPQMLVTRDSTDTAPGQRET